MFGLLVLQATINPLEFLDVFPIVVLLSFLVLSYLVFQLADEVCHVGCLLRHAPGMRGRGPGLQVYNSEISN